MSNDKIDSKILNKLQTFFKIGIKPKADKVSDQLYPLKVTKDEKGEIVTIGKEKFPPMVEEVFRYWMEQHDSEESWINRDNLWTDLDNLYYNDSLNSRSINLMADEAVQADVNQQPIFVEAKSKLKKDILKFYDDIGLYKNIRPLAMDIVQYGNAGIILGMNKNGIDEIIPISVKMIKDRLEFTPFEIQEEMKKNKKFQKFAKLDRVEQLYNSITNKENITSFFKSYLFGFQIGDYILPPWRFLHFRNLTNKSPFKPFGMPFYVHMLAPWRQWDAAMTFQVMARALQFPVEIYEIDIPNAVDPAEKMAMLGSYIEKLDNLGITKTNKEDKSLGTRIFTIKDLFTYDIKSNDIDLKKLDDLEYLYNDRIISTRLPRNIIDPNDSSFGDSGVSLIQKWKEFARSVYHVQSIILDNITQLTKIHLIETKKYEEDEIEFILSMPYPESQVDTDLINNQQELISLCSDIIELLSDKLMGGDNLPDELIQDILNQILPYDQQRVDAWYKIIMKSKKSNDNDNKESEKEEEGNRNIFNENKIESNKKWKKLQETYGKEKLNEKIQDLVFQKKYEKLKEGKMKNSHYYTSNNTYLDFNAMNLVKYRKEKIRNLKEKGKKVEEIKEYVDNFNYDERIKYKFRFDKNKR